MVKLKFSKNVNYNLLLACLQFNDAGSCAKLTSKFNQRWAAKHMTSIEQKLLESLGDFAKEADEMRNKAAETVKPQLAALESIADEDKKAEAVKAVNSAYVAVLGKLAEESGLNERGKEEAEFELSDDQLKFLDEALDGKLGEVIGSNAIYVQICDAVDAAKA